MWGPSTLADAHPERERGGHDKDGDSVPVVLWSKDSLLSIGSTGSILSVGSVGSILSIGSAGSFLSVISIGSFASIGSVLSSRSRWFVDVGSRSARCDGERRTHTRRRAMP